jgi:HK97 gp10 family phage protein
MMEFNVDADELLKNIKGLPQKSVKKVKMQAIRAGARVTLKRMKSLVPVDTGDLKRSLAIQTPKGKIKSQTKAPLVIGAKEPQSHIAHFAEFGTIKDKAQPFMRPAISQTAKAAIDKMAKKLDESIKKELSKVGGRR